MAEQTALAVPEQDDDEALAIVVEVEDLKEWIGRIPEIANPATAELASGHRSRVKAIIAEIKERRGPDKKAKELVWREAVAGEKAELAGPEALFETLNTRLGTYEAAKRREKVIAEARATEEARRLEAARPAPVPGEPPRMPIIVPATPVETKIPGVSFTPHYDVVEDVQAGGRMELIKQVAKGWGSPMALEPNMPMLKDMARQAKGDIKIPGYRVVVTQRPRG